MRSASTHQRPSGARARSAAYRCSQVSPAGRSAMRRPEKIGMAEGEFGRHHALGDQPLRPVEIGQQRIEQPRALLHARFDCAPFAAAISSGSGSSCQGRSRPCGSA